MSDPTALPNFMASQSPQQLRDRVVETLTTMGAEPEVDDDGDVRVKVEEQLLFIRTMDGELPFMRIFGQWQIGEQITASELDQLRLANEMTTRLNLIKLSLHFGENEGDNSLLLAAADVVVGENMPLDRVLANCVIGILNSVKTWHNAASGTPLDEALRQQQEAAENAARQAAAGGQQAPNAGA